MGHIYLIVKVLVLGQEVLLAEEFWKRLVHHLADGQKNSIATLVAF